MNKRIQALADEAEDYADSIVDQGGEFHPAYTQKLTELIVKECADVCYDADYNGPAFSNLILKHFGVEE